MSRSVWSRMRYRMSHSSGSMARSVISRSIAANAALIPVPAGRTSADSRRASPSRRSSIACASELVVRCAAAVARRRMIAARARSLFVGRPRDRDVRRIDADPEARPVELDEPVGSQGSHVRARDAGQDQRGQREHRRGVGRLDGQTRDLGGRGPGRGPAGRRRSAWRRSGCACPTNGDAGFGPSARSRRRAGTA